MVFFQSNLLYRVVKLIFVGMNSYNIYPREVLTINKLYNLIHIIDLLTIFVREQVIL